MVACLLSIHFWFYLQPGAQPGQGFGVVFHLARDEHDELRIRAVAHRRQTGEQPQRRRGVLHGKDHITVVERVHAVPPDDCLREARLLHGRHSGRRAGRKRRHAPEPLRPAGIERLRRRERRRQHCRCLGFGQRIRRHRRHLSDGQRRNAVPVELALRRAGKIERRREIFLGRAPRPRQQREHPVAHRRDGGGQPPLPRAGHIAVVRQRGGDKAQRFGAREQPPRGLRAGG